MPARLLTALLVAAAGLALAASFAVMHGARQTLRATVAIRETADSYVVRVLRMS